DDPARGHDEPDDRGSRLVHDPEFVALTTASELRKHWCAELGLNQSRLAKRRGRLRLICYLRTFVVAWTLADLRRELPAGRIRRRRRRSCAPRSARGSSQEPPASGPTARPRHTARSQSRLGLVACWIWLVVDV